jgi:hypothetical protein
MFSPLNDWPDTEAMFRGVATALIAMAAFDLYVLDGRYIPCLPINRPLCAQFLRILGALSWRP